DVTLHVSVVDQGGILLVDGQKQPLQVLRAETQLDPSQKLAGFDPVLVAQKLPDGSIVRNFVLLSTGGATMLVPAGQVKMVQSVPGQITVGTNVSSRPELIGAPLGITTLLGGGIDVFANGDINVEKSRISTFQGGDINLTSTHGIINAGSGSR